MFRSNPLIRRIAIGKLLGFAVGIVGIFVLTGMAGDVDVMLMWGFFLWYITFGAIIGMVGIIDRYPLCNWPCPWWLRGALVGAWLDFVIVLLGFAVIKDLSVAMFGAGSWLASPWWLVLEGAVVGLVIDGICTAMAGEGEELYRKI